MLLDGELLNDSNIGTVTVISRATAFTYFTYTVTKTTVEQSLTHYLLTYCPSDVLPSHIDLSLKCGILIGILKKDIILDLSHSFEIVGKDTKQAQYLFYSALLIYMHKTSFQRDSSSQNKPPSSVYVYLSEVSLQTQPATLGESAIHLAAMIMSGVICVS